MPVRRLSLPWDGQPAPHDSPQINEDLPSSTLLLPNGGRWFDCNGAEGAFTAKNTGSLSAGACEAGVSVLNSSIGYFSRANPIATGPLTIVMVYTPTTVTGVHGIWSMASTAADSNPAILLQRDGANVRIFVTGYGNVFTGVAAVGVPMRIALGFSDITNNGASRDITLAVNGQALTTQKTLSVAIPNEFLGSGYNGQAAGHYSLFARLRQYSAPLTAELSSNPWQVFAHRRLSVLVGSAAGDATVTGATLTATATLIPGAASGEVNASVAGQTLTAAAGLIAGAASASANATVNGQTLTATASLIAGAAASGAVVNGQLLTITASLLAGGVAADSQAAGTVLSIAASLIAGSASADANATVNGQTLTAQSSLTPGSAYDSSTVRGLMVRHAPNTRKVLLRIN